MSSDIENQQKTGITRRQFFKGSAAVAVSVAAGGLLVGCSDDEKSSGSGSDKKTEEKTGYSFETPPKPIKDISSEESADVIVVGSGMSGLTTALSAAESGAKVILISGSKQPISRGGSNQSTNSKVMKKYGVKPFDASKKFQKEYLAASYRVDQKKWSKYHNRSEEAMDWLIDKVEAKDIKVTLERDNVDEFGLPCAHGFVPANPKGSMVATGQQSVVEALDSYCKEVGVKLSYSTVAEQLVREDNNKGRVTAVIAKKDGKYIKYNGKKAVVLATGDFSANREMMEKYCPWVLSIMPEEEPKTDYNRGFAMGGLYKGDGQKMGLWVGAAWQKTYPNAPMIQGAWGGGYQPLGFHEGLVVNSKGQRFYNENISAPYSATHLLTQSEYFSYGIWGTNYAQDLVDSGREWHTFGQLYTDPGWTPEQMLKMWDDGVKDKQYFKADTIEDLCTQLNLPVEETVASVTRYNELCKKGTDDDFLKDPTLMIPVETGPFYAAKNSPIFMTVMGGLRTDVNMQVLDKEDNPIPGLFNVGQMIGDMYADTYNFALPGQSLGGCCLTFGYVLGRELATDAIEGNKV